METNNNHILSPFIISNGNKTKPILIINSKTWNKETHGLFDYETAIIKRSVILVQNSTNIIRRKNDVREENIKFEINDLFLFKIEDINCGQYYIYNSVDAMLEVSEENINLLMNKIWYVLPSLSLSTNLEMLNTRRNLEYPLRPYDVIKLGRVKYNINHIFLNGEKKFTEQLPVFDYLYKSFTPEENYECRYCLTTSNEEKNPLVSLCKCKGGATFIHYKCVKQWMSMKLSIKENSNNTVTSYNFKTFNCEICKSPYPCKFKYIKY